MYVYITYIYLYIYIYNYIYLHIYTYMYIQIDQLITFAALVLIILRAAYLIYKYFFTTFWFLIKKDYIWNPVKDLD